MGERPTPPVVLICYNRADLVRTVLTALRPAAPAEVFVIADGPRDPADRELCDAVRAAVDDEIDWPCTVHRRYAEHNLGCDPSIELGLDWVFEQVPAAIVLEDDCVPDPSFFGYCAELLERYRDDPDVMQVSGTHFAIPEESFGAASYVFTTFSITWGWASWRRAWRRHREIFPRDYETSFAGRPVDAPVRLGPTQYAEGTLATAAGRRYFDEVGRARGHEFGWDSQWFRSQALLGTVAIAPAVNLVHNAGFGVDATHTVSTRAMPPSEPIAFPLVHPRPVRDSDAERALELAMVRTNGRLARSVRRLLPQGRLRTWGRSLAERLVR